MKRLLFVLTSALLALFFTTTAEAATTITPSAAPTGTHFQSGTATCSTSSTGVVTCSSYQLAGVGNADATASLSATYTATVQCRNHGGQIVEVKSTVQAATATTGRLSPKNGRLTVPSLSSSPAPTAAQFEAGATCPNGNWTKETLTSTIALSSFVYTLHFKGFTGDYIRITG